MKKISYVTLFVFLLVSAGCANMSQKTKCVMKTAATGAVVGAGGGAAPTVMAVIGGRQQSDLVQVHLLVV